MSVATCRRCFFLSSTSKEYLKLLCIAMKRADRCPVFDVGKVYESFSTSKGRRPGRGVPARLPDRSRLDDSMARLAQINGCLI